MNLELLSRDWFDLGECFCTLTSRVVFLPPFLHMLFGTEKFRLFCEDFHFTHFLSEEMVTCLFVTNLAHTVSFYKTLNLYLSAVKFQTIELGFRYAIPKIKMLCNLRCLKARLRLLCNKLSMSQQPEPRFGTA